MMLHKKLRHPERSEAVRALLPGRQRPNAVEGPRRFYRLITAGDCGYHPPRHSAATSQQNVPCCGRFSFAQARSFDSGSANRPGEKRLTLAFAQDDGSKKKIVEFAP